MACDKGDCSTSCMSATMGCGCGGDCYDCSTNCGDLCKGGCTSCTGCSSCSGCTSCSGTCKGDCNNGCTNEAYTTAYTSFNLSTLIYAAEANTLHDWSKNEASRRNKTVYDGGKAATNTLITAGILQDIYNNIKSAGLTSTYTAAQGQKASKATVLDYISKLQELYETNIKK